MVCWWFIKKGGVAFVDASGRVLYKRPSTGAGLARGWRLGAAVGCNVGGLRGVGGRQAGRQER